jgi:integrating conjugative element protein (TIGR03758 family)
MTAAQEAAFLAGAGIAPNTLLVAIAGITLTLTLIWAVWLTLGMFAAWQAQRADLFDVLWGVLRACIVLLVLGFTLR